MPATAARMLLYNTTGEGTYGSTTAATSKLHGVTDASLKINSKTEVVPGVGWLGPSPTAAEMMQSGEGSMDMVATYEEMPRIFNGIFAAIGASTSTSGAAPYNYPYTAPVTSTQVCYTYTWEYGATGALYKASGVVFNGLTIRGEVGDWWRASVPALCKQVTAATGGFTTAANVDRTVNPIKMSDTTLYVDAFSTGTIGGTSVAATLISFELNFNPNRHLKTFAGSKYPNSWGEGKTEASLKMTAEFNASAKAYVDELLGSTGAEVRRQIRLGATQGSSAAQKTANLDFAGILVDGATLFSDREGNITVDLTWQAQYSTGLANHFAANFQNGSSSTT